MKRRGLALALALGVLGAFVAVAVAAPQPGKAKHAEGTTTTEGTTRHGKPAKTGADCRPRVAIVLKGTLAADGAAAPFALSLNATSGNRFGHTYLSAGQPLSVEVTSAARVRRRGSHDPGALKTGDRVVVQARACKADLADGATPPLTAARITANPPKAAKTDRAHPDTTETATDASSGG